MGVTHRSLLQRLRGLEDENNKKLEKLATYIFDDQLTLTEDKEIDNNGATVVTVDATNDKIDGKSSSISLSSVIDYFNKDVFLVRSFEFLEITLSVLRYVQTIILHSPVK